MFNSLFYLVILVIALSGCLEGHLRSIDVADEINSMRTLVTVGKTSRSEIKKLFGEPFIVNNYYQVEIYQVSKDSYGYYLLAPIPVPVGFDDVITFAMVIYDENSIVKDIAWDYFQSSNSSKSFRHSATVVADGFLFESFEVWGIYPRTEVLFGRESHSQQSLHSTVPQGKCLLYIAPGEYEYKITLDANVLASYRIVSGLFFPFSHSVKEYGWYLGFITTLIPTGEHTLSVHTRDIKPGVFKKNISCDSGEKYYAYPEIEKYKWTDKMTWEGAYRYRGEIVVSDTLPVVFEGRRLILYHGGKWLVPE